MRKNTLILSLIIVLCVALFPGTSLAAVSVSPVSSTIHPGSPINITGTSDLSQVIIKVYRPDQSILYFNIVDVVSGVYSDTITLGDKEAVGTYQIQAGQGTQMATTDIIVTAGSTPNVAKPTASPAGGAVASGTSITLSSTTSGALIYYTIDGSNPTTSSLLYSTPIVVNSTLTIKSIAVHEGMITSGIMTASYTISPSGGGDGDGGAGGGGGGGPLTPAPTPEPKPEVMPDPKPEVKFDDKVVNIEKMIANLKKKAEEAKANPTRGEFKDTTSHWANGTINTFVNLGVVTGYEDGTFHPNASITRAEFATIIAKVFNLSAAGNGNKLSDTSGHWAEASIHALTESGIIAGYEDGTFRPNKEISRAEIVAIISRILNLNNVAAAATPAFSDINSAWNKDQIERAAAAGIITGAGNGQFAPNKPSSRAEALTIILRALQTNADINTLLESIK
ncbi:MAG: S-layer homology domain-containing protein [Candidatus Pristimantibacillus sp.]